MAFQTDNLRLLSKDDRDTHLWSYKTEDALGELEQNEYWQQAVYSVSEGDVIIAISAVDSIVDAAHFVVAKAFSPTASIIVNRI
jgi:hypothetical protein